MTNGKIRSGVSRKPYWLMGWVFFCPDGGSESQSESGEPADENDSDQSKSEAVDDEEAAEEEAALPDPSQKPAAAVEKGDGAAKWKAAANEKKGNAMPQQPEPKLGDANARLSPTLPSFLKQRCIQEVKTKPALLVCRHCKANLAMGTAR